jgi:hypothetical protein
VPGDSGLNSYQEVEIAALRIETFAHRRAEQRQLPHAVTVAKLGDLLAFKADFPFHASLPRAPE